MMKSKTTDPMWQTEIPQATSHDLTNNTYHHIFHRCNSVHNLTRYYCINKVYLDNINCSVG